MARHVLSRYFLCLVPVHDLVNPAVIHHFILEMLQGYNGVSSLVTGEDIHAELGVYFALVKFVTPVFEDRLADYLDSHVVFVHSEHFDEVSEYVGSNSTPGSIYTFAL